MIIPHPFAFDPSYGYTLEELLNVELTEEEPSDFDAFWEALYKKTLKTSLNLNFKTSQFRLDGFKIEEVYFDTLEQVKVGAWLLRPLNEPVEHLMVEGHGYGGRQQPNLYQIPSNTAIIFPCAPGFDLSEQTGIPNTAGFHVISGIENKDTYIFRSCAAAWWSAASVLLELYPAQAENLYYRGWSYGGGMGCLMLPWDNRYKLAELGQVSFCNHPIRLGSNCIGSGEAVRLKFKRKPEIRKVLRYFDAAYCAKRIQCLTVFACSKFDPAVPPAGQFTAYNMCPAHLRHLSIFTTGHYNDYEYPEQMKEYQAHWNQCAEIGLPDWRK